MKSESKFFEEHPSYALVEHERLSMMTTEEATTGKLSFDVVIVGSGAGGGVAAAELATAELATAELATAGYSVSVIEKGTYHHQSELAQGEFRGFQNMYDTGAIYSSVKNNIDSFSGGTFGDRTAINYSVSLKLHLNTEGKAHYCIRCSFGFKSSVKNSILNIWLKDAHHHGARFLYRIIVTIFMIENKKAIGVECQAHGSQEKTFISAKHVVAACRAMRTPTLLKSSGLLNSDIGRHLRLQGNLGSCISHLPENWKGDYYGAKIEDCTMLPGALSLRVPWYGSAQHKELMLKHKSSMLTIIIIRDKDSVGKIIHDSKSDIPLFDYKLGKHDAKSLLVGIEANMKMFVAAGAHELYSLQPDVEPFIFEEDESSSVTNPRFIEWLKSIHKAGIKPISVPIAAGHHMSSCRMGVNPKTSATKSTGETWEVKHLYVADSSLLPTALCVNPMVAIEATSLHVSRQIKHSLQNTSRL
ncbi:uncharacterized protein B0P05DRAFT_634743 [Gilbertella persicaria]|uniref:uncharacterized protein n=1 Tax=Gilbertella persicaria TaxID=101096 RepID=UPI002220CEAA|nr:uncharacterized protein B0P05DRAFT_634743 [Gilbertella persicaria]KAI8091059.1 hypothetical protein B0P05DRAFT_634743 [Gilbertella persicaria]